MFWIKIPKKNFKYFFYILSLTFDLLIEEALKVLFLVFGILEIDIKRFCSTRLISIIILKIIIIRIIVISVGQKGIVRHNIIVNILIIDFYFHISKITYVALLHVSILLKQTALVNSMWLSIYYVIISIFFNIHFQILEFEFFLFLEISLTLIMFIIIISIIIHIVIEVHIIKVDDIINVWKQVTSVIKVNFINTIFIRKIIIIVVVLWNSLRKIIRFVKLSMLHWLLLSLF